MNLRNEKAWAMRGLVLFVTLVFVAVGGATAQMHGHDWGSSDHPWPDSLETVSVQGTIIEGNAGTMSGLLLDTNGDLVGDYVLDFGPWWMTERNGVSRPAPGDAVEITGALRSGFTPPTVVVFEINGSTWRLANEYGTAGWVGQPHWSSSAELVTVSGVVMVDSTYFYTHRYLDSDEDGLPNYLLGLGPDWYQPSSGIEAPADGERVEIKGWESGGHGLPMLIVASIDGKEWRADTGPAPWAGSWMTAGHTGDFLAYCLTDSLSVISFPSGHMNGQMGGMGMGMWPDSMFVQFWEVHPDSLPDHNTGGMFAGFHVDVQNPTGQSMMGWSQDWGHGRMRFSGNHTISLTYDAEEMAEHGGAHGDVAMYQWDATSGEWQTAQGLVHNGGDSRVDLSTNSLATYYALGVAATNTALERDSDQPVAFTLSQNYPNPFNPETTIRFTLIESGHVTLRVFDLLGRIVATPFDDRAAAGLNEVRFNSGVLPSGTYIMQLSSGANTANRSMVLQR